MTTLLDAEGVADALGIPPEHVEQIIAMHEVEPQPPAANLGQTPRSRRRAS
jgi:hypothetical protein